MKALIVGLGSIGRRHLSNFRALRPQATIAVLRRNKERVPDTPLPDGVQLVHDLDAAVDFKPDVALVANPAPYHVPVASALAAQGIHLFVEKPISNTTVGVAELIGECQRRRLVLMVGYTLRFNFALRMARDAVVAGKIGRIASLRAEVGLYLPEWRPGTDYKEGVTASQALGGGALLEMSHELDYVRWICGEIETVSAQLRRLGTFEIDVEDTAEIVLQMRSGSIANIHLDMIQRSPTRYCRIIGTEGTLIWDGIANSVQMYSPATGGWSEIQPPETVDRNKMYLTELQHFLECVSADREPCVTGEDGLRVLEIVLAARRSDKEGHVISL